MSSKLTFLALAIMILIVPTMATPYPSGIYTDAEITTLTDVSNAHYNVTPGNAIGSIVFTTPQNTNISFTLGYGNGNTITGHIDYIQTDVGIFGGLTYGGYSYSRVEIGGNESSNTYLDAEAGWLNRYGITGHATDEAAGTQGLAVWDTSIMNFYSSDNIAYIPISNIASKPIYWIDITSNRPIQVDISTGKQTYIQAQSNKNAADIFNEWLELRKEFVSFAYGVIQTAISWTLFIWENIGLIIALYIALTGFMAFQKGKKNILRSIQIFFGYQITLFTLILGLPHYIIDVIDKVKSLLARWI